MKFFGYIALMLCIPFSVSAEVLITEIMYAPDGADSKHEWIEVCSDSTQDIIAWKFYENDTNHGLSLISGASSLGSGECAIIADNSDTFLTDYPGFSGNLIDSAFSLSNTGETISLKDDSSTIVDSVTYSETDGAKDDGNSLHRSGSTLTSKTPTPGSDESTSSGSSNSVVSTTQYSYESVEIEPPQDIYLRTEEDIITNVGSYTKFSVESYDATGSVFEGGSIYWTFGDGASSYGREVKHKFLYEGEYNVVVEIKKGTLSDSKNIQVKVVPMRIVFSVDEDKKWISIKNKSEYSLDVSEWRIMSSGQYFKIPENTIISPNNTVLFPREITKLALFGDVFLVFPDGARITTEEEVIEEVVIEEIIPVVEKIALPVVYIKPVVEEEKVIEVPQVAAVILSESREEKSKWTIYLFSFLVFATIGILFTRSKKQSER